MDEIDELTRCALRARAGDPAARTAVVRTPHAEASALAGALRGLAAAATLTPATYLRAFRALPDFAARSSVRTWLLGIARRACADHVRASVRRRRLDARIAAQPAQAAPDPAALLGHADLLRCLPEGRRSAFVLTQLLGMSYAEAAAVEGVPVGTIRSRVARARTDLVSAVGEALVG